MLVLKPTHPSPHRFPWQEPHACREDRAMGLELELIEAVRSRELALAQGGPVAELEERLDQIMAELAQEAALDGPA